MEIELKMLEKQMAIEVAMSKIQNWIYKNKERILDYLNKLYKIVCMAVDWDIQAINFINNKKKFVYPEKYIDDAWNIYEVKWIHETALNQQWKNFDKQYKWTMKIWFYLNSLEDYIQQKCWYRQFKIKLLSSKK